MWLYSLVCVGPGRKPRRPVFSQRGSSDFYFSTELQTFLQNDLTDKVSLVQTTVISVHLQTIRQPHDNAIFGVYRKRPGYKWNGLIKELFTIELSEGNHLWTETLPCYVKICLMPLSS